MQPIQERLADIPQVGRVEWIGLTPEKQAPIKITSSVIALDDHGLEGDYHAKTRSGSKRQVTLIQAEHLPVIAALSGHDTVPPERLRRNIVVSGINLLSLKEMIFQIGEAILEGTGPCVPCELMDKNLGHGGKQAMRGHGGITAKVLSGGTISIGDQVQAIRPQADQP